MSIKYFLTSVIIVFGSSVNVISQDQIKKNKMLIRYVKNGVYEQVKKLLEDRADVNVKNKEGLSLKELTTDPAILKLLQEHIDALSKSLIHAVKSKDLEHLKKLLESKDYTELSDEHGVTALIYAAKYGLTEISLTLLKSLPELLDKQDNSGATALMIAIQNGQEEIIDILLLNKAKPDLKTKTGESAIIIATNNLAAAIKAKNKHKKILYKRIIDKILEYDPTLLLKAKDIKVVEPESDIKEVEGFGLINFSDYKLQQEKHRKCIVM